MPRRLPQECAETLPRIRWLLFGGATLGPIDQSLKDALAQTGLVDGRNIEIVFRYANGKPDQLAGLASQLVAQKPDLLLAVDGDVIKPLFEASKRCSETCASLAMVAASVGTYYRATVD